MLKKKPKIIILGAGLAGLSAAYHGDGRVFEKSIICGGTCNSPKVDGYIFDLGIHVLHTKNEEVLKLLEQDLKIKFHKRERVSWIYSYDRLTRYPFQANTYGLPVSIVKECLIEYFKAYCNAQRNKKPVIKNYEDWINSFFGKGIARLFMNPYSEQFWTVPPKDLTTDWMDVRIPMPSLEEVVEGALTDQEKGFGPNAIFRYPRRNGISEIPRAFIRNGGVNVSFNKEAAHIDLKRKEVTFSDGDTEAYDVLISTIPLPELFKIVKTPKSLSETARKLKYNSIICVNLGIDREKVNDSHWIHFVENKYSFFRISFLSNYSSSMAPKGKSSISAEIAYSKHKKINKDTVVDDVIKDLIKTKIIDKKDRIELVEVSDIKYGYVIYDHERSRAMSKIKRYFSNNSVILSGRYANWEYQWMDDAILDGKRAAKKASKMKLVPVRGGVSK